MNPRELYAPHQYLENGPRVLVMHTRFTKRRKQLALLDVQREVARMACRRPADVELPAENALEVQVGLDGFFWWRNLIPGRVTANKSACQARPRMERERERRQAKRHRLRRPGQRAHYTPSQRCYCVENGRQNDISNPPSSSLPLLSFSLDVIKCQGRERGIFRIL